MQENPEGSDAPLSHRTSSSSLDGEEALMAFQVTLIRNEGNAHITSATPVPAEGRQCQNSHVSGLGTSGFALSFCFHLQKPKALVTHGREHRAIFLLGQHTGLYQTPVSELAWGVSPGYQRRQAILHQNNTNKQTPSLSGAL